MKKSKYIRINQYLKIIAIFILLSKSLAFSEPEISKENLQRHIQMLASDEFQGRGTGEPGLIKAAHYLRNELESYGIKPLAGNDYFLNVPMQLISTLSQSKLEFISKRGRIRLDLYEEYIVANSGNASYLPKERDMVFVGYGIDAPEFDYNDYENVDVTNKVVVMLSGEPISENNSYFNGFLPTIYSFIESKSKIALSKGAVASIIIPNPYDNDYQSWEEINRSYAFEEISLPYFPNSNLTILLKPNLSNFLFRDAQYSINDILEMYLQQELKSFPLETKFSFQGEYEIETFSTPNVAGIIEGSRNKNTYIVVSAHYDHLGIGPEVNGDTIYNGAFDNAAGCSALLEIARNLHENNTELESSVIVMFLTGEEYGLLGSTYFLEYPPVGLSSIKADINIDGLAFIDEFNSVLGVGANYSNLDSLIKSTAKENGLYMEEFPPEFKESESFNRSDQIAFAYHGIPSVLIIDGTDYRNISSEEGIKILSNYMQYYYHTPFDDNKLPINFDAAKQHSDFLFNLVIKVSKTENIIWKKQSPYQRKNSADSEQ